MSYHTQLVYFLSAIAAIFGLVSCKVDLKQEKQGEQWSFPAPQIQSAGRTSPLLTTRSGIQVGANDFFVFSDLSKDVDKFGVDEIEIRSLCLDDTDKKFLKKRRINFIDKVLILDTLPREILFYQPYSSELNIRCLFSFSGYHHGVKSQYVYKSPQLKVLLSAANNRLAFLSKQGPDYNDFGKTIHSDETELILLVPDNLHKVQATLFCEKFRSETQEFESADLSLTSLLQLPAQNLSSLVADPRWQENKQVCRILLEEENHNWLSPFFNAEFVATQPDIQIQDLTKNLPRFKNIKFPISRAVVTNTSLATIHLAIMNKTADTFRFQILYPSLGMINSLASSDRASLNSKVESSNGTVLKRDWGWLVTLNPQENLKVLNTVQLGNVCLHFEIALALKFKAFQSNWGNVYLFDGNEDHLQEKLNWPMPNITGKTTGFIRNSNFLDYEIPKNSKLEPVKKCS
jgi:hypothetical protein